MKTQEVAQKRFFTTGEIPTKTFRKEWDGQYYHQNSSIQQGWALSFIKEIEGEIFGNILDVGCGSGKITSTLSQKYPHAKVVGIDLSHSMIETASKNYSSKNLRFFQAHAEHFKLQEKFDSVTSFSSLHWIKDKKSTLQSISSNLNPKGKLFLFFAPEQPAKDRLATFAFTATQDLRWRDYFKKNQNDDFYFVSQAEFTTLLSESHFQLCLMQEVKTHNIFSNQRAFIEWMRGWMPHLKKLPESEHDDFLKEIVRRHLENYPLDSKDQLHYYSYMLKVIARV